jgi:hypothetical protein
MYGKFFNGRYGFDNFNLVLLVVSFILVNFKYVWILGAGLTGYALFRTLSRNIDKRRMELEAFNKATYGIRKSFAPVNASIAKGGVSAYRKLSAYKSRYQQRKQYVFIKCTKCKNMLRLPRNKGKLSVTCPVCKTEFIKKT